MKYWLLTLIVLIAGCTTTPPSNTTEPASAGAEDASPDAAAVVEQQAEPEPEPKPEKETPKMSSDVGVGVAWTELFNGQDLTGWVPKIRGHVVGLDPMGTYRVEDGFLTVSYENYGDAFDNRFGHLFFDQSFDHYLLLVEYRFIDERAPQAPDWTYKNSGVMLHSQSPDTMLRGQDFPISIEVQFLGGPEGDMVRPTANMCSPGTHINWQGEFTDTHCINSDAPTFRGDEWVTVEVEVKRDELVRHYVNGVAVMEYGGLVTGGGVVSGHLESLKPERAPLTRGYISLQSEGHALQFRRVALKNLNPSMDE